MIATLTRAELRRGLRDRSLIILWVVFGLLAAYAAWSGSITVSEHDTGFQTVVEASLEQRSERRAELVAQEAGGEEASRGARLPYAQVDHIRMPFQPGAALSISQMEAFPAIARVTPITDTHGIFDEFSGSTSNPEALAAGPFDLAFLVTTLLPLFVLAAMFDLWTGDRERGIAKQVLAEPVRPDTLLASKAMARIVLVVLPLSLLTGIAAFFIGGLAVASAAFILTALYAFVWVGVCLAVNVMTRRPTEAAVASGVAWLVIVVLIPATLGAFLDLTKPAPSRAALANASRAVLVETQNRGEDVLDAYLNQHPTATDELEVVSEGAQRAFAVQLAADKAVAPVVREFWTAESERRGVAEALRFASPTLLVQDGFDHIAGFNSDRALAFRDQAYAHLDAVRDFVTPRIVEDRPLSVADFDALPSFAFAEPSPTARQSLNSLALLAYVLALLAFGLLRARNLKAD